jgi:hypothetical protein
MRQWMSWLCAMEAVSWAAAGSDRYGVNKLNILAVCQSQDFQGLRPAQTPRQIRRQGDATDGRGPRSGSERAVRRVQSL